MDTDDSPMTIARLSALTPAEQAVLDEALTEVPAREIAEHLSLSEATVRSSSPTSGKLRRLPCVSAMSLDQRWCESTESTLTPINFVPR